MNWITIKKDSKALQKDYSRYFNFSYKMLLKQNKLFAVGIILALIISLNSFFSYINHKKIFDLIICIVAGIFATYHPAIFFIKKIWFMKDLKKDNAYYPDLYDFSFDENGLYYNASEFNSEIKWDYFNSFEVNPNHKTIYIYSKSNRVEVLLTQRNLGELNFKNLLEIISKKLPLKKYN